MNSYQTKSKGFTLIELLVVIAIIAVLAVIGFAVFSGLSTRGNDARRQADVKAIADALEVKRANVSGGSSVYVSISGADLAGGTIPKEPTTRTEKYCFSEGTASIANPAVADWGGATPVACPTGWANLDSLGSGTLTVAATTTFFRVCTINEAKGAVICYGNRQ